MSHFISISTLFNSSCTITATDEDGASASRTINYTILQNHAPQAIGDISTAFGDASEAYGYGATAFGDSSKAFGDYSTAFGEETIAAGEFSTSFGHNTQAGRLLYEAGADKGITVSYQTLCEEALKNIGRENLDVAVFNEL